MIPDRRAVFTPYPYGMCKADADLADDDAEPSDLIHPECAAIAQHRNDEVLAFLLAGELVAARSCWCAFCEGLVLAADYPHDPVAQISNRRFITCRECGDKRCPRAAHHDDPCANRSGEA